MQSARAVRENTSVFIHHTSDLELGRFGHCFQVCLQRGLRCGQEVFAQARQAASVRIRTLAYFREVPSEVEVEIEPIFKKGRRQSDCER